MKLRRLLGLIAGNLIASRVRALLAMVGIVVGTALLVFFLGLGQGLRERVLNRIFPVNQLEIEPQAVQLFGTQQVIGLAPLDEARVKQVAAIPGVVRAFGKQKSSFPARLWGGKEILGYNLFTEAFFDGMPVGILADELAEFEDVTGKRAKSAKRKPQRCDVDMDCAAGAQCQENACETVIWASLWRENPLVHLPCGSDSDCLAGTCTQGICHRADAPPSQRCSVPSSAGNGRDMDFDKEHGELAVACAEPGGFCKGSEPCPPSQYCATDNPDSIWGWCESPLPAVLNPLLLEVFNSDMARSLGAAPVGSLAVLYGVRFHVALGDSFFTKDAERNRQQYKQAIVVGFSRKAPELGLAMPLSVVRHYNARLRGAQAALLFDAVLLETTDNQDIPSVVAATESLGFSLSRKSRAARTFGTVVLVVSLALMVLAAIVLVVAATQIAQTFAMLVHERRKEIAVLRALGAAQTTIAALVLGEAAIIGLIGGTLGSAMAYATAAAVDYAAKTVLERVPLVPDGFFVFPWWAAPLAVGVALIFCCVGALLPALRAARVDPARVLSEA